MRPKCQESKWIFELDLLPICRYAPVDYVEDAATNRVWYSYDPDTGRRLSQTDAFSNETYYAYTRVGQQKIVADGVGVRTFIYSDALPFTNETLLANGVTNVIAR